LRNKFFFIILLFFSVILFAQSNVQERLPKAIRDSICLNPDSIYANHTFNTKVYLANYNFKKDVDFSNTNFNSHQYGSVDVLFPHVAFEKDANFYGAFFFDSVNINFRGAQFSDSAKFDGVEFGGFVGFYNVHFDGTVDFQSTTFTHKDGAAFDKSAFWGEADFRNIQVSYKATFESVVFKKETDFSNAELKNVFFNSDTFESTAKFNEARMTHVSFNSAAFSGTVFFDDVNFSLYAGFRSIGMTNKTNISFKNAHLPDTLDFSDNINISITIDLSIANFDSRTDERKVNIFLYRSEISKFHFDYQHFKLLLIDPTTKDTLCPDECYALYEQVLKKI